MRNTPFGKHKTKYLIGFHVYFFMFIILYGCGTEQNKKIDTNQNQINFVNFEFTHSMRIPNHKVSIRIIKRINETEVIVHSDPMNNDPKWLKTKINKRFKIKANVYNKLSKNLLILNKINFVKAACNGKDGTTCSIEIGKLGASKTYTIWSPDYDTQNRELVEYLKLCKQIISIGKLDPKDIL